MILNDLQQVLLGIDENTYYGTAALHPKDAPWDYIVFSRDTMNRTKDKSGYADYILVELVREEFVPDELVDEVISAVEGLAGFRLCEGQHEYWYAVKPSSHLTVEKLVLKFAHARKK